MCKDSIRMALPIGNKKNRTATGCKKQTKLAYLNVLEFDAVDLILKGAEGRYSL